MRQPMSIGLVLLVHWSVRQKLNRVSSAQLSSLHLRRSKRAFNQTVHRVAKTIKIAYI